MASGRGTFGFTWEFLREVAFWSLRVAGLFSLLGFFLTKDPAFAIGCIAGSVSDVLLVRYAVRRGEAAAAEGRDDPVTSAIMLGGRLALKAIVLIIAFSVPQVVAMEGAFAGLVAYDVALAIGGSAVALREGGTGAGARG